MARSRFTFVPVWNPGRRTFLVQPLAAALVFILLISTGVSCRRERPPDTLVVGIDGSLATLDPHLHNDAVTWSVLSNFYDALVNFSADMRLTGGLAESWQQLEPELWRFQLRRGALFSDGRPVTPADVIASFERARDHPRSRVNYHLLGIQSMEADGGGGVMVTTRDPISTLPNRLTALFIVPAFQAKQDEITHPVGSGPYRFLSSQPGGSAVAMEGWQSWRGIPAIRRARFELDDSPLELLNRFLSAELDVIRQVPDSDLTELRGQPGVVLVQHPRLAVQMVSVNPEAATGIAASALADVRVRRAMLAATDRERWVRTVYRGQASPASQYVHPVVFGFDPAVAPTPHSLTAARTLMAEAGFADGFEITLDHAAVGSEVMAALVEDWSRIGIVVRPREHPWREFAELLRSRRSAVAYFGWGCATGDASDFLIAVAHTPDEIRGVGADNFSGYSDPVTDALIAAAERELDPSVRLDMLHQAQRRILGALPILPLTVRWSHLGAWDRVDVITRHDQWLWVHAYRWR